MSTELAVQLDDVIRTAQSMRDTLARGEVPDLSDGRILRGQAQCAEHLIELEHVRTLRDCQYTPESDAAAQVEQARRGHAHADRRARRHG